MYEFYSIQKNTNKTATPVSRAALARDARVVDLVVLFCARRDTARQLRVAHGVSGTNDVLVRLELATRRSITALGAARVIPRVEQPITAKCGLIHEPPWRTEA